MKSFGSFNLLLTSFLSILSTTQAATVTLQTTQCIQPVDLETFTITVNELGRGVNQTCGLKLVSSDGVPLTSITCLAYRDAAGTVIGSAVFNSTSPALIATNPVDEGSIKCTSNSTAGQTTGNSTASTTSTITTLTSAALSSSKASGSGTGTGTGTSASVQQATGGAAALKQVGYLGGVAGMFAIFL